MPLNEGLSYYLFTYLTLNDVRIVYRHRGTSVSTAATVTLMAAA
jgi:hypothetical protein